MDYYIKTIILGDFRFSLVWDCVLFSPDLSRKVAGLKSNEVTSGKLFIKIVNLNLEMCSFIEYIQYKHTQLISKWITL